MLWQGRKQSTNVDDRRGIGGGGMLVGGGVIGVIVLLINMFMGGNVDPNILNQLPTGGQSRELSAEETAADDQRAEFVKVVLQEHKEVWN